MTDPSGPLDICVVGSGLAALCATRNILKANPHAKIAMVEAQDRVGGRVFSVKGQMKAIREVSPEQAEFIKHDILERGASFYGETQYRMLSLLDDFNLTLEELPEDDAGEMASVADVDGLTILFTGDYPGEKPVKEAAGTPTPAGFEKTRKGFKRDLARLIGRMTKDFERDVVDLRTTAPHDKPHLWKKAAKYDTMPLTDYVRKLVNRAAKPKEEKNFNPDKTTIEFAYKYFLGDLYTYVTTNPAKLSALSVIWYISQGETYENMGTADMWLCKEGNSAVVDHLRAECERHAGFRLVLSCPIGQIDYTTRDNVKLYGTGPNAQTFTAKRVLLTMPPYQVSRINFVPELDSLRRQEYQHWPMGIVMKCFMQYPTAHWLANGLSGRAVSYSDDSVANDIYDYTRPHEKHSATMLGFMQADNFCRFGGDSPKDVEARIKSLGAQYARIFKIPQMAEPNAYYEATFASVNNVGGCYSGMPDLGAMTLYKSRYRTPIYFPGTQPDPLAAADETEAQAKDRQGKAIFFTGTECANCWTGYMEGANEAGTRVGVQVCASLDGFNTYSIPTWAEYEAKAKAYLVKQGVIDAPAAKPLHLPLFQWKRLKREVRSTAVQAGLKRIAARLSGAPQDAAAADGFSADASRKVQRRGPLLNSAVASAGNRSLFGFDEDFDSDLVHRMLRGSIVQDATEDPDPVTASEDDEA